jgi:hypothetical protein
METERVSGWDITGFHVGRRRNRGKIIPLLENFQTESGGHTTSSATNLG